MTSATQQHNRFIWTESDFGAWIKSKNSPQLREEVVHAPSGYTDADPLVVNGKEYHGGEFIPGATKAEVAKAVRVNPPEAKATGADKDASNPAAVDPAKQAEVDKQMQQAMDLAAKPGTTPEHIEARKKVASSFLKVKGKRFDRKTGTVQAIDPERQDALLQCMDLSKPIVMGPPPEIPPPDVMTQWQGESVQRGAFFSTPGTSPEALGIGALSVDPRSEDKTPKHKREKKYRVDPSADVSYLMSTASEAADTWSVRGTVQSATGGGTQYYIPEAVDEKFEGIK